jgi:hypothetical protein
MDGWIFINRDWVYTRWRVKVQLHNKEKNRRLNNKEQHNKTEEYITQKMYHDIEE